MKRMNWIFPLRSDTIIAFNYLPSDLRVAEAERITGFLRTLVQEKPCMKHRKHVRTTAARGRKHLSSCTGYRTPDPTPEELERRKAAVRAARERKAGRLI